MSTKTKAPEFLPGYNVSVHGRHVQVTESMKDYALEKLAKIERLSSNIIDITITMDIQKLEHRVDIIMRFSHFKVKVQASSDNMYASIDKAIVKLQHQIRKYKDRIQEHQAKGLPVKEMRVQVFAAPVRPEDIVNDEIESENAQNAERGFRLHEIVRTESRPLKILTAQEAVMKMELSGDSFLVYRSEEERKLKVIYRMRDGNYGVIAVEE